MGFMDSLALISIVGLTGRLVFDSPLISRSDPWTDRCMDSSDSSLLLHRGSSPALLVTVKNSAWARISDEVAHLTSWTNAPCRQAGRFSCRPLVLPVTSSLTFARAADYDYDSNHSSPLDWMALLSASPDAPISPMTTALSPMTTAIDWLDGIDVNESSTSELIGAVAASNEVHFDTARIDDNVVTNDDMDDLIRYIEGSPVGATEIKNDHFLGAADADVSMDDSFKLAFDTESPVKSHLYPSMNYSSLERSSFSEIDQTLFDHDYENKQAAEADKISEADQTVDDFLEKFIRTSDKYAATPSADEYPTAGRTTPQKSLLCRTFAPANLQPAGPAKLQPTNNVQARDKPVDVQEPVKPAILPQAVTSSLGHFNVAEDHAPAAYNIDDSDHGDHSDDNSGSYAGASASASVSCSDDDGDGGGGGGGSSTSTSTSNSDRPLWPLISLTTEELVIMHIDRFNEAIAVLSETGKLLARKIRQKGKNKLAARTCRKRRVDEVDELGADIDELVRQKSLLMGEQTRLREDTKSLNEAAEWLNNYIVQHLRGADGVSHPERRDYRLQCFDNGSVFLVPSSALRLDEPRKRVLASA